MASTCFPMIRHLPDTIMKGLEYTNSGIVGGQTWQVARRKCITKSGFDVQKTIFGEIIWRKVDTWKMKVL